MKDLETLLLMMSRDKGPSLGAWISSIAFVIPGFLGFIIAGIITGEVLWLLIGGAGTVMSGIPLIILIIINIHRNKPRW